MTRKHSSFMAEIAAAKKDASELRKVMGYSARTATLSFPASREEAPVASGEPDYAALEREHMGDPDKRTGIYSPRNRLGSWLSAALEDPAVCEEMKSDIRDWFASPSGTGLGGAVASSEAAQP